MASIRGANPFEVAAIMSQFEALCPKIEAMQRQFNDEQFLVLRIYRRGCIHLSATEHGESFDRILAERQSRAVTHTHRSRPTFMREARGPGRSAYARLTTSS